MLFDSKKIFVIPIYFRNLEEWHRNYNLKLAKYLEHKKQLWTEVDLSVSDKELISWEINFNKINNSWYYNEIVGFLEIKVLENILYAYLYKIDSKRYSSKMSNKKFILDDKVNFPNQKISSSILSDIEIYISVLKKSLIAKYPKFRKYHFDYEHIKNLFAIKENL